MIAELPPGWALVAGAFILPLLPRGWRPAAFVFFPLAALTLVLRLPDGTLLTASFLRYELVLCQVDALSRAFGIVFALIAAVGAIYALHIRDTAERVAAALYAGGALGVTFAGDLLTLLVNWELMAAASTWLVWSRRTPEAGAAGLRYLLVHLFGGALLLAGVVLQQHATGTLDLAAVGDSAPAAWLILIGVAVNAAIPPLHAWLPDSYPEASVTGAVFLSAFTTKAAVYVLARMYAGWEVLLYLGVVMTLYGVLYAVLATDIRRILAYHIVSQVGYMVAGVGIGTGLSINGTTAHAFSHILYKALLFMATGVVLHTTGRSRLTELGGLARQMPVTLVLFTVGALAISGAPLLNGFISKTIIVTAAAEEHHYAAHFLLVLASAGTFLSIGLKLLYFTWFGPDRGLVATRPPANMVAAMGILALLCFWHGAQPGALYRLLPHPMVYTAYAIPYLVENVQVLVFTFVAFWMLRAAYAPAAKVALDVDWLYRRPASLARRLAVEDVRALFGRAEAAAADLAAAAAALGRDPLRMLRPVEGGRTTFDPDGARRPMGRTIAAVLFVAIAVALWSVM